MSSQSFADLGVSRAVSSALAERGITEPFAIQKLVIADVLAGRDVLAQSPTGSGKTLAFGVPMVDRVESTSARPAALVLAPTRELVSQIVEELRGLAHARALKIAAVYGGVGLQKQSKEAGRVARDYTQDAVSHSHAPTQLRIDAVEHRFVNVERDDRIAALIRALRSD